MFIVVIAIKWAALALSLFAASKVLDGFTIKGGAGAHLGVAAIYAILMVTLGNAVHFLIGLFSLGFFFLFSFFAKLLIGTLMLKGTDAMSEKLKINSFSTAFMAALITAVVSVGTGWVLENVLHLS